MTIALNASTSGQTESVAYSSATGKIAGGRAASARARGGTHTARAVTSRTVRPTFTLQSCAIRLFDTTRPYPVLTPFARQGHVARLASPKYWFSLQGPAAPTVPTIVKIEARGRKRGWISGAGLAALLAGCTGAGS